MRPAYEFFDHTADVGLRAFGGDLPELFTHAGRGLLAAIEPCVTSDTVCERVIRLDADDRQELLFVWLRELLAAFVLDRVALDAYTFAHLDERRLEATCRGHACHADCPQSGAEIKAVTYHQLTVEPTPHGWMAEVVLDT